MVTEDSRWSLFYEEYVAEFKAKYGRLPNKGRENTLIKSKVFNRIFQEPRLDEKNQEA